MDGLDARMDGQIYSLGIDGCGVSPMWGLVFQDDLSNSNFRAMFDAIPSAPTTNLVAIVSSVLSFNIN